MRGAIGQLGSAEIVNERTIDRSLIEGLPGLQVSLPGAGEPSSEKKAKYRNRKTEVDGIEFASKKEADRYVILRTLQKCGVIFGLATHPKFRIEINGMFVCNYNADFDYIRDGQRVVEDVKAVVKSKNSLKKKFLKTTAYSLKKRLMKAVHGIDIVEV